MVNRRRVALLLIVVGMLCLPAPQYLIWAAEATTPPPQTSQVYVAESINLSNESDRNQFVDRHSTDITLVDTILKPRYHEDEYRSPGTTRDVLRSAMKNGSATVSDDNVRADLQKITDKNEFIQNSAASTVYYRLTVAKNGSTIRAESVSLDSVATTISDRSPHYENLSTGEQRTVDAVLDNSTGDASGYRPQVNDPFVNQFQTAIWKGDTLYSIYIDSYVDGFGPSFGGFLLGLGVAAIGVTLVLIGGRLYIFDPKQISWDPDSDE